MRSRVAALTAMLALSSIGNASAALVTSSAGFENPVVIDFSQYSDCTTFAQAGCEPPRDVGELVGETVTFTGSPGISGAAAYNNTWSLADNGQWTSARNGFVGLNVGNEGFIQFTFDDGPVSAAGAFINYGFDLTGTIIAPTITALDADDNVLESYDLGTSAPIATPDGVDDGAFRGIVRSAADIASIRFETGFVVVDDLTFSREADASVPEPGSLLLIGSGVALVALSRRLRKLQ